MALSLTVAGLASAAATALGGLFGWLNNKKTNETNESSVKATNETNKKIQDSINAINKSNNTTSNIFNLLSNRETNQANVEMNNMTNSINRKNVMDTNDANVAINDATNAANLQIAQEANEANERIYGSVNDTNLAIAQSVNELNKNIADENMAFQREKYEYDKALQQEIFNREDTSYQRTAEDMAKAGLNPLSMSGTNGAGSVVSTSAPQNSMVYQGATMQAHDTVTPTMNGLQLSPFQAVSGRVSPSEWKAVQQVASKMQAFQGQMAAFDWLSSVGGNIQDMVMANLNHGIQVDQLNEAKKNNNVDRIAKLMGVGLWSDEYAKDLQYPQIVDSDGRSKYMDSHVDMSNPRNVLALQNALNYKSLKHDTDYNLYNNSTEFERNITGLQYMLDTDRLQSIGKSLYDQAFDLFGLMSKLYNK